MALAGGFALTALTALATVVTFLATGALALDAAGLALDFTLALGFAGWAFLVTAVLLWLAAGADLVMD